jgi:hypothetical protein
MSPVNLHNLSIAVDGEKPQQLKNHSVEVKSPHFETLEVIFKDQESKLFFRKGSNIWLRRLAHIGTCSKSTW